MMTKHVIDHHRAGADSTSAQYSKIEADRMPRPQTQELQKRPRKASDGKRLKEFAGIERRSED